MKIYDVTVPTSEETPVYACDPNVEITTANSIKKGDAANVSRLCFGAHTATHVDAPNHFIEGTRRVHELELEKLLGECRVVELHVNKINDETEPQAVGYVAHNSRQE